MALISLVFFLLIVIDVNVNAAPSNCSSSVSAREPCVVGLILKMITKLLQCEFNKKALESNSSFSQIPVATGAVQNQLVSQAEPTKSSVSKKQGVAAGDLCSITSTAQFFGPREAQQYPTDVATSYHVLPNLQAADSFPPDGRLKIASPPPEYLFLADQKSAVVPYVTSSQLPRPPVIFQETGTNAPQYPQVLLRQNTDVNVKQVSASTGTCSASNNIRANTKFPIVYY